MPDILLIQPPIEDFYLTEKRTMPYGLACIAAALRRDGFSVKIIDALATKKRRRLDWPDEMAYLAPFFGRADDSPFGLFHRYRHYGYSYQHLAELARRADAFLIGISSLFTPYSHSALETAAAVKAACPRAAVVLGGHHPTAFPREVLRHPAVDFVLRGDGEVGLPLLARALQSKGTLDRIPGLAYKTDRGDISSRPPAVVHDLNQMLIPAFDLIDWSHYQRGNKGSMSITAGRGCPLRCTYCAVNAATYHGFRQRNVDSVMAELDAADAQKQIGFIDFEDEHISADRMWFTTLLRGIVKRFTHQKPELRAMNGLFAPSLDSDVIAHMTRAGFKTLNLALITTDMNQLKRFNRPNIAAEVDRVLGLAHQNRLNAVAYIIIAGPYQDPYASVEDLLFLAQRPVLAGVSVFYPAPDSPDYHWCQKKGMLPTHTNLMRATTFPLNHITNRTQAVTLLRLGRILNFMKGLIDDRQRIPMADNRSLSMLKNMNDRRELGKILLSTFLKDGTIYGKDDNGEIYSHQVDKPLIRTFLSRIHKIQLRGTHC